MAGVFAIETPPFLHEAASFIFGRGSPGTGTSSRSVHGIGVFGKTLLPLLFGRATRGIVLVATAGVSKISLECEEFAVVLDGSLMPVAKFSVSVHRLHLHHGFLESNREPSEIVLA